MTGDSRFQSSKSDQLSAGTLQPSWGQDLAGFRGVFLNNTNLQGRLPDLGSWAHDMGSLVHLDLGWNWNITGSFPAEWAAPDAFPQLQTLYLSHVSLSGPLPGKCLASLIIQVQLKPPPA